MPKHLLPVTHLTQAQPADCLAACAQMVLNYLKQPVDYDRLLRLLAIRPQFGAPSSNIEQLSELEIQVDYGQGRLSDLEENLGQGHPCIVFVKTRELSYWNTDTAHAVVVVGIDDDNIYLNDPAFDEAPQIVPKGDFDLAWLEADEYYALLRKPS